MNKTEAVLRIENDKDIVIGIGGGGVIDTAKIISKNKRCISVPTTAAGASMTPYATVWGERKISVSTKVPILKMDYNMPIDLPHSVRQSTTFDALSHSIESFWSKNATALSKRYSKKAIYLINRYFDDNDINILIKAGNSAGQAIAITKTNVVHATSYPITIKYGIDHGSACGILLPHFVEYMDYKGLLELFNFDSTERLVSFLKKLFFPPKIKDFDAESVAGLAVEYKRINQGPREISRRSLERILKNIA